MRVYLCRGLMAPWRLSKLLDGVNFCVCAVLLEQIFIAFPKLPHGCSSEFCAFYPLSLNHAVTARVPQGQALRISEQIPIFQASHNPRMPRDKLCGHLPIFAEVVPFNAFIATRRNNFLNQKCHFLNFKSTPGV